MASAVSSFLGPNFNPTPTAAMLGDRGDNQTNVLNSAGNRIVGVQGPATATRQAAVNLITPKAPTGAPQGQVLGASTSVNNVAGDPHPNLDPMFQPLLDNLQQSIGDSTNAEATQEGALQSDYQSNQNTINNQLGDQMGQFGNQQNQLSTQTENAKAQARQGAAEIQQGLQARYGGTTGTGAFASELSGRQANQSIGQLNQNAINGYQAIDTARNHAQALHDSAIQDLNSKLTVAKNQAKDALAARITQIKGDQANLQGQKASLTQLAIQHYQDTVNQINQFNTSFQQNLALEHQKAQDYIAAYAGRLGGTTPQFGAMQVPDLKTLVGGQTNTPTDPANAVNGQLDFNKFPQNGYSM